MGTDPAMGLRQKYREERDRRLKADRESLTNLQGELEHYLDDPYAPTRQRPPYIGNAEVVIVGAGFGGLLTAASLREQGLRDIRLVDAASDVGGVWYWNRYPGAMCDVESYVYLPLLEKVGTIPSQKYASATEILAHAQAIASHYQLYEDALFQTTVSAMSWDDTARRWRVRTDRGDDIGAQFVIIAIGSLSKLSLPAIDGIDSFKGVAFHASRWNYDSTGGSPTDPALRNLRDKVVGLVGTGATGIQCVPPLARWSKHLYVFQRTPSTVSLRANRPTDRAWFESLPPGWQERRTVNFTRILEGYEEPVDLVDDSWTRIYRRIVQRRDVKLANSPSELEAADLEVMNAVRTRIDASVTDRATADALKPYYRYLCKRPCFHDEYLPSFNRPNVTLVDTHGVGVTGITARGVTVADQEYSLDCLVFATGFDADTISGADFGFEIHGRGGYTLRSKWANGMRSLHGMTTAGFPNLIIMPGPNSQSASAVNFMHRLTMNARHAAYIMGQVISRGFGVFEVAEAAEQKWVDTILRNLSDNVEFLNNCTPGRLNREGNIAARKFTNSNYGPGLEALSHVLADWRSSENMRGIVLSAPRFQNSMTR